ncbi:hypothetical protein BGZ76_008197, partial [Entomortierella beljakovae]
MGRMMRSSGDVVREVFAELTVVARQFIKPISAITLEKEKTKQRVLDARIAKYAFLTKKS